MTKPPTYIFVSYFDPALTVTNTVTDLASA